MFLMPNEAWSAILGAAVGSLVTYRFAVTLAERQFQHLRAISKLDAWHVAAREFISAFADEIATLESSDEPAGDIMDYLRSVDKLHAKAVAVFEHFVPEIERASFIADWQKHRYGEKDVDWPASEFESSVRQVDLLYLHYSNSAALPNRPPARTRAIARMKELLAYAKDA